MLSREDTVQMVANQTFGQPSFSGLPRTPKTNVTSKASVGMPFDASMVGTCNTIHFPLMEEYISRKCTGVVDSHSEFIGLP